jgi:hypothetical protein
MCVVGDELCAGIGDPRGLGWVGRVIARTEFTAPTMTFTLPVPHETLGGLKERWESETALRFGHPDETDNRLIIASGRYDVDADISLARSRLHLAGIIDHALGQRIQPFVLGPPPGRARDGERIAELSRGLGDVCNRRNVPYVEVYEPLAQHEQWLADAARSRTGFPGQDGYGLIAWLVLHTRWRTWLGLTADDE